MLEECAVTGAIHRKQRLDQGRSATAIKTVRRTGPAFVRPLPDSSESLREQAARQAPARVLKQFVREHTQAVNGRRLDLQNDWAEGDRLATVGLGEGEFCGSEIAFRADEHEDAGRAVAVITHVIRNDFLEMLRIGLERADELQVGSCRGRRPLRLRPHGNAPRDGGL